MITVTDLARRLLAYARQPGNDKVEVMLQFDGDVAFPFDRGDDHQAMGINGVERFLVFCPDEKGKKLILKGKE